MASQASPSSPCNAAKYDGDYSEDDSRPTKRSKTESPVSTMVAIGDGDRSNSSGVRRPAIDASCISCLVNLSGQRRALLLPSGAAFACTGCLCQALAQLAHVDRNDYPSLAGQTFYQYEDIVPTMITSGTGIGSKHTCTDTRTVVTVRLPPMENIGNDILTIIFGYLDWTEVMKLRVCRRWREASRMTKVQLRAGTQEINRSSSVDYQFDPNGRRIVTMSPPFRKKVPVPQLSARNFERVIQVLPMIETVDFRHMRGKVKVVSGSDTRDEVENPSSNAFDLNALRRYHHLKRLHLDHIDLEGTCPVLKQLGHLQVLDIKGNFLLKFDLDHLSGLHNLMKLNCSDCVRVGGNLSSLKHLAGTLEHLDLSRCESVVGNLLDVADFSRLRTLNVVRTKVMGDIRHIGPEHFRVLETFRIEGTAVFGGAIHEFDDANTIAAAWQKLVLQRVQYGQPILLERLLAMHESFSVEIPFSSRSFDKTAFEGNGHYRTSRSVPLHLELIFVASQRFCFRWTNRFGGTCDVVWIGTEEPDLSQATDIEAREYGHALRYIKWENANSIFRGYLKPPTPAEYKACLKRRRERKKKGRRGARVDSSSALLSPTEALERHVIFMTKRRKKLTRRVKRDVKRELERLRAVLQRRALLSH